MMHMIEQGGWVMLAIGLLSVVAWGVIVWKWLMLRAQYSAEMGWARQAVQLASRDDFDAATALCRARQGCTARMLLEALRTPEIDRNFFDRHLRPLLDSEALELRRGLRLLQTLAGLAPLLGLLGTVLGMVHVFSALTAQGTPEATAMAGGISQALLTTQAGLIVALPIVLMHGCLESKVRRCIDTTTLYTKQMETAILHD